MSSFNFPYAHDVRTVAKADISEMQQCHAKIHQLKTEMSDSQVQDWCKCQIGINKLDS